MKLEYARVLSLLTICLATGLLHADGTPRRQECRDFIGDRSNCQRFVRCFHNLRVLFSCASGTAYVPELQTCVAKELVNDCDDSKNRDEVTITANDDPNENEDYPTIEADLDALEAPMQKSLFAHAPPLSIAPRQFGCSSYCYNQGVCVLVGQRITCRCPPGFIGTRCQVSQSAIATRAVCSDLPCLNGATCVDTFPNTFTCLCTPDWTDDLCSTPLTTATATAVTTTAAATTNTTSNQTCSINPCLNGASCITVPGGGFSCVCAAGYTGLLCEISGAITGVGCGTSNPCLNSGVCVPTSTGNQCQCSGSFSGSNCQSTSALSQRNQCQPNPCQNGGSCYLTQAGFACACTTGFSGTCCETNLGASNPCYTNPCRNSGTCQVVAPFTYRCICPGGYLGIRCEQLICNPNPCLYGGVCLPLGNSFQCQCPAQYTGTCCELLLATTLAPNPCSTQPCQNGGTCSATSATTFICTCSSSYYGRCCELRNYCQPNPCYNGGTCVTTTNGYICQCTFPNSGSNCELMITTPSSRPACACILCPCPTTSAAVTNPCFPNPCQNNGGCTVNQNNAQCYCQPANTGYYCQYTRKRTLSNSLCANITCQNGGECHVSDLGPQCSCPKPFFGDRCEIINRPRTCFPSPCGKNGQCMSTNDGYKCLCKNETTGILCEQTIMPKDYRWCPLDCRLGTTCMFEGTTPKCRVLSVY